MKRNDMPPVMILCVGKGTRLREVTEFLPKPMVPIGEQPIVWHIIKTYATFGCRRFILCLGYKREAFVDYFKNYHLRTSDATITPGHNPKVRFLVDVPESDWEMTLVGTGLETITGGHVARGEVPEADGQGVLPHIRRRSRGRGHCGDMTVYRHEGFWQCMDSGREYELLNKFWKNGTAPWTRNWK